MAEEFSSTSRRKKPAPVIENGCCRSLPSNEPQPRSVGNIYLGRVSRVLPGMGAAFLDIGLERTAFLHVSDVAGARRDSHGRTSINGRARRPGIVVQVTKDPPGPRVHA